MHPLFVVSGAMKHHNLAVFPKTENVDRICILIFEFSQVRNFDGKGDVLQIQLQICEWRVLAHSLSIFLNGFDEGIDAVKQTKDWFLPDVSKNKLTCIPCL